MSRNMKTLNAREAASLALVLSLAALLAVVLTAPRASYGRAVADTPLSQQASALERGYRTGYSDGYQAGYRDTNAQAPRDYKSKDDYSRADRAYASAYGALEDYRDGYQQGYEAGYAAGYERRGFDSTVPAGLTRRGGTPPDNGGSAPDNGGNPFPNAGASGSTGVSDSGSHGRIDNGNGSSGVPASARGGLYIPGDTVMRVELLTNLSTQASQRGDTFEARVIEPREYENAMVYGHVTHVRRAGRASSGSELQLAFERINLPDNRSANISAQVIQVVKEHGNNVGKVDPEGGVHSQGSTKDNVTKVGAGAGIGAVIGAIAGGGAGAAVGAVIGGGVSTGGVLASHGKNIRLPRGQQLLIRTAARDTNLQ